MFSESHLLNPDLFTHMYNLVAAGFDLEVLRATAECMPRGGLIRNIELK